MEVIDGQWYLYGKDRDDPGCVKSSAELLKVIEKVGFLPLFDNAVPGFSVENMTAPECWWCGDESVDPWEWRVVLSRTGKVAYGKFFGKKAGFVSKKWFPYFANFRREGYDFDARFEEGKADIKEKLIMDLFWPKEKELWDLDLRDLGKDVLNPSLLSFEVKDLAGFGKGGEKGFEGTCAKLQMGAYLLASDFQQRRNKSGESYGWAIARYTLPEYLWGYEFVTGQYKDSPENSREKIVSQIKKHFPCDEKVIRKVIR
ncbi:MAG: hypothetical protein J6040_07810 [Clostridiales bacterium]|nr:hypothetical protein [Clostridiales bacterium]MBP5492997.1 hypothetical protein [Clostridiales bacterium]